MRSLINSYSKIYLSWAARSIVGLSLIAATLSLPAAGQDRRVADNKDRSQAVPSPVLISGNPTCKDLNAINSPPFTHITENWGFKIDRGASFDQVYTFQNGPDTELQDGAGPDPNSRVRVQATGNTLNWLSNRAISAVIVKGGPGGANVYPYNPPSLGGFPNGDGTGLTTGQRNAISHIVFCFESLAPSAAMVSVGGRVTTTDGSGMPKTYVRITDPEGNVRVALTNGFGYYFFDEVEAGKQYVITATKSGFRSDPQIITVNDVMASVNFVVY